MALEIKVYKFSKKINSTKQPDVSVEQASFPNCELKEGTSILTPTIIFDSSLVALTFTPNYVYIAQAPFKRYYYVTNLTYEQGRWFMQLAVDPLASFKTEIGLENAYVVRSSVASNGLLMDNTYPTTTTTTTEERQAVSSPWETDSLADGCYVVGIAGQKTTYYIFLPSALELFLNYLFSDLYLDDVIPGWTSTYPEAKVLLNPTQFITSIMWMPFVTTGTSVSSVRVGYVDVDVAAWEVSGSGLVFWGIDFTPYDHPQISRGSYMANAPYSLYNLFYPPFGKIELDSNIVANTSNISTLVGVDLRTGEGTLTVFDTGGYIMSWIHSKVGVNYQVSQVVNPGFGIGQVTSTLASGYANAMSGNIAGAISGGVNGIAEAVKSKIPSATTIGSNGSINGLRGIPTLQHEFIGVADENNSNRGRPLCENRTINTLGGYIMVEDADISLPATDGEIKQIEEYMEGGFFYE